MKKTSLLPVALLSAALLLVGAACYKTSTTNTNIDDLNSTLNANVGNLNATLNTNAVDLNAALNDNTNAANANTNASVSAVSIENLSFVPTSLTVKAGTTVTWTNNDSTSHTVTSLTGSELSSGTLGVGQTYSHTFTTAGTYQYHCTIHTSMTGTVIVTN